MLAEIGFLVLLFGVGLEPDLRALVRVGASAALVAAIGVVTPFALGWGTGRWLRPAVADGRIVPERRIGKLPGGRYTPAQSPLLQGFSP